MDLAAELARYGPQSPSSGPTSLNDARGYCRRLATSHYENFTVVSRLWPRHLHQHLCNVYAYCRWADDLADETNDPQAALELLDWWEGLLQGAARGEATHPVFVALADTLSEFRLPAQPFADLLIAFRQDQRQTRYQTNAEVLDYCRNSANPVGRIVLHLGRCFDEASAALSDSICTGLQLANFCQDVKRDFEQGRIYLPLDDCREHGCEPADLAGPIDGRLRGLLQAQCARAEGFLRAGEPLSRQVSRDLRLPVRLFIDGGLEILRAIERQNYDVWTQRPTLGKLAKLRLLARGWWRA